MPNDIIVEMASAGEIIVEMASAGEIIVEISGMTYQSVSDQIAALESGKADKADTYTKLETDAQFEDKVQNFKIKNKVVNGDFSQGLNGWYGGGGSTFSVVDGKLEITSLGTSDARVYTNIGTLDIGDKVYISAKIRTNDNLTKVRLILRESVSGQVYAIPTISSPALAQDITHVDLATITTTSTANGVLLLDFSSASAGAKCYFDNVLLINLKEVFGVGNEPTKEEMNMLVKMIPNGWWDGELSLTQKQIVDWLLKLEREKANKAQEAWINPTLLNGWVNFDNSTYAELQYMRDNFGFVRIKGMVKNGINGTSLCSLPVGYRPSKIEHFPITLVGGSAGQVAITTGGALTMTVSSSAWSALNGICFKAGA